MYQLASYREASDERDRIFALAGLLKGRLPPAFVPDYRRPASEILLQASRYYFVEQGYLDCDAFHSVVHDGSTDYESDVYPSWVPNDHDERHGSTALRGPFEAHGQSSTWYALSAQEDHAFWNPPSPDELVIPGILVEAVSRCTSPLPLEGLASTCIDWLGEVGVSLVLP